MNFLEGATLGDRMRLLRISKGLSQQDVSNKSGVSQQVISVLETRGGGTHPSKLVKLAEALECDVEELLPDDLKKCPLRKPRADSPKPEKSFSELMAALGDALENELGFRPTNAQALRYIIKRADPANQLGLMAPVEENEPESLGMSR